MTTSASYIDRNVLYRCEKAVADLAQAQLIPSSEMPDSEREIHEWWLVTPELGLKLNAAGLPVMRFGELNMWGRFATAGTLADDADLLGAIGSTARDA